MSERHLGRQIWFSVYVGDQTYFQFNSHAGRIREQSRPSANMALGSRSLFRADGLTLQTGHMRTRNMGKYSEIPTDLVMAPRNGGVMEKSDLIGHPGVPGRGAFMVLFLKLEHDRISAATYHTVGCGPTIASGSMLTEMIAGRSIAECRDLTVEHLIEALDGMPPDKMQPPGAGHRGAQGCALQVASEGDSRGT